jgi:carboxymethylenebutenolidase
MRSVCAQAVDPKLRSNTMSRNSILALAISALGISALAANDALAGEPSFPPANAASSAMPTAEITADQYAFAPEQRDWRSYRRNDLGAVRQPAATLPADLVTERVQLSSDGYLLEGCIVRPPNLAEPLPAIIYNHGSEKDPPPCGPPQLTSTYVRAGIIFFAFQRRGHGASQGTYIRDLQKQANHQLPFGPARQRETILLHEDYNADVTTAVRYLLTRADVDPSRVAMTGVSYGGIQTLLSAEKRLGLRGFIVFAPGAQSWSNPLLRERLARATRNSRAPIFLAQAQNDFSTGPVQSLGPIVEAKGLPSRAILYPAFGTTQQQGHGGFAVRGGIPVWRNDVFAFLNAVLR